MAKVFNLDKRDLKFGDSEAPVEKLANLIVVQAVKDRADEIILTRKSRAEWIVDVAKDAPPAGVSKTEKIESSPRMESLAWTPVERARQAMMDAVIEAAERSEELEAKLGRSPVVENPLVAELVYVIPGKGRVRSSSPPVCLFAALIRVFLLYSNIPFLRAMFLRFGIPYWNHGPVEGTFQLTFGTHNSMWKLESADTRLSARRSSAAWSAV